MATQTRSASATWRTRDAFVAKLGPDEKLFPGILTKRMAAIQLRVNQQVQPVAVPTPMGGAAVQTAGADAPQAGAGATQTTAAPVVDPRSMLTVRLIDFCFDNDNLAEDKQRPLPDVNLGKEDASTKATADDQARLPLLDAQRSPIHRFWGTVAYDEFPFDLEVRAQKEEAAHQIRCLLRALFYPIEEPDLGAAGPIPRCSWFDGITTLPADEHIVGIFRWSAWRLDCRQDGLVDPEKMLFDPWIGNGAGGGDH